ncbi:MAG: SGNH/GDSL hydrolase family protein [Devosia sp.]
MKTILCFGDSLTYGSNPITGAPRHAYEDRWPGALARQIGAAANVVAEGLGGRTTVHDDWFADADRNGARILPTLLSSHGPLDLVVIMLGTNDLKPFHGRTADEAARGMVRLVEIVRGHAAQKSEKQPKIILVAPPAIVDTDNDDMLDHFGGPDVITESRNFAKAYERRAHELGVHFFDASAVARADPADGVHLNADNTRAIGEALVPLVKSILDI